MKITPTGFADTLAVHYKRQRETKNDPKVCNTNNQKSRVDIEIGKTTYRTGVERNPEGFMHKLEMLLRGSRNPKWAGRHELGVRDWRWKLGCHKNSDGTKTPSLNELTKRVGKNRKQKYKS